jgi:hypothetical protein
MVAPAHARFQIYFQEGAVGPRFVKYSSFVRQIVRAPLEIFSTLLACT